MTMKPVDVVVPWVDGSDPSHRCKRDIYKNKTKKILESAKNDIRFEQTNEIFYCLNSVLKFMPWVRRIYLVTDNQVPEFIKEQPLLYPKIEVVDHVEIFRGYESLLPSFNSRSIASCFWRIPNISDEFIVLCDDFVVLDYVPREAFFEGNKKIIYGKYQEARLYRKFGIFRNLISKYRYKRYKAITGDRVDVTQKTANKLGFKKKFVLLNHSPMIFSKKSFDYFFNNIAPLEDQLKYKFRSTNQYLPEAINAHFLLSRNEAVVESGSSYLYELYAQDFTCGNVSLDQVFKSKKLFLCAQSVEAYPKDRQRELFSRLDGLLDL